MGLDEVKATAGRVLGVDFGEARTGLAVSDVSRVLACGLGNIAGGGLDRTVAALTAVVAEQRAAAVIIGLPVNMDGTEGPRAARVRELAARLQAALPAVPVALFDERMSTMTAARYLNATDTRGEKRKRVIDTLSAQIILQDALDRMRR